MTNEHAVTNTTNEEISERSLLGLDDDIFDDPWTMSFGANSPNHDYLDRTGKRMQDLKKLGETVACLAELRTDPVCSSAHFKETLGALGKLIKQQAGLVHLELSRNFVIIGKDRLLPDGSGTINIAAVKQGDDDIEF